MENLREIPLPSLPSRKARQYPYAALLCPTPAATRLRFLRAALQVFGDTANAGTGLGENAVTGASGAVGHYRHGHLGNSVSMSLDELQGKKGSTKKRRASRTS